MSQLELIAYLAGTASSVADRRELDELLRRTDTRIDDESTWAESQQGAVAA
jgi:hypothetical protein